MNGSTRLAAAAPIKHHHHHNIVRQFAFLPVHLLFVFLTAIFRLLFIFDAIKPRQRSKDIMPRNSCQQLNDMDADDGNVFEKYSIVNEHCFCLNISQHQQHSTYLPPTNVISARAWIDGKKWEFSIALRPNGQHTLKFTLLEMDMNFDSVTAQVIFWVWHRGKRVDILQKSMQCFRQPGDTVQFVCNVNNNGNLYSSDGHVNLLVRLLDARRQQQFTDNKNTTIAFPLFDDDEADTVKLLVASESFAVSKHYLMSISPVFHKMFTLEMREKQQKEVCLPEMNAHEFRDFLDAISPSYVHPNPQNVQELLKLADRFQVESLRARCESHLMNCVEMPLFDRLLCAEMFRLEKLKNYILKSLTGSGVREFYEENQMALNLMSKELLIQLTTRICFSMKNDRSELCQNCQKNLCK